MNSIKSQKNSIIVGLCLVIAAVIYFFLLDSTADSTELAPDKVDIETVEVLPVKFVNSVVEIQADGFTEAKSISRVNSKISGHVKSISDNLVIGKWIKKDEFLLDLNSIQYQVALTDAKQQLAEANLKYTEEKIKSDQAKRDISTLKRKDNVSSFAKRIPQLAQAKANVEAKQAALKKAQYDLKNTTILAPFDGVVLSNNVAKAEWIDSQKEMFTLANTSVLNITLPLSRQQWALIENEKELINTPVEIEVSPYSNQLLVGQIKGVSPQVDKNTGSRSIVIEFLTGNAENDSKIPIGAYVKVVFNGKSVENSFWIPLTALTPSSHIWGVDTTDNTLIKIPVEIYQYKEGKALVGYDKEVFKIQSFVLESLSSFSSGQNVNVLLEKNPQTLSVIER